MTRVIITMPAYRAEATLEKTVAGIPAGIADELILVDDASSDNTAELARSLGISVFVHPQNRGYGGNQKTCYTKALQSGADIVVMLHPDYQYEPKSVPLLIAPILAGEADMTFGSRFAGLGDPRAGGMPMYRFLGNRITTTLENLLLGSRFSEMHSGMRAYTRRCLLSLPFLGYSEDFSFDGQFMVDAVTSGQRVVEVPIPTRYTKESSSIGIARSLKYVAMSVMYAARRSAERGRRGRRNPALQPIPPAARSDTPKGARRDTPVPPSPSEIEHVVSRVTAYALGDGRVLQLDGTGNVIGNVIDRPAQGSITLGDATEGAADAIVVWDPPDDTAAMLTSLRERLSSEGLAAIALRGDDAAVRAGSTKRALADAGLKILDQSRIPSPRDRRGSETLLIARALP